MWIFVLITGYFMVSSKGPVVPKLLKLWLQVFTTSVIFNVIFIVFGDVPADSIEWTSQLLPVISGTWWFASAYLIFLPFVPFVNRLLNGLDRREHLTLIVMMLFVWFVIPSFTHSGMYGSQIIMFLAMYVVGAYIGLHPESFDKSAGHYGMLTLASIGLMALLIAVIDLSGPVGGLRPFESTMVWGEDRSIIVVLVATLTFLTFRRLDLGRIRWINVIASTTFGVYLIQEHTQMRHWIFQSLDMGSHYGSPDLVPYVLACMLGIFALCSVLEFVRMQTVERATTRLVPRMARAVYRAQSALVGDRRGDGSDD